MTKHRFPLGDIRIWKQDLQSSSLDQATKSELLNNVAPLLELIVGTTEGALNSLQEQVGENSDLIAEIIEHEDSFLQPDLSEDLVEALLLGLALCELIKDLPVEDELKKRKLDGLSKGYRTITTVLLEKIEEITLPEGEEDEDEGNIHGESGSGEKPESRGEGASDAERGTGGRGAGGGRGTGGRGGTGGGTGGAGTEDEDFPEEDEDEDEDELDEGA